MVLCLNLKSGIVCLFTHPHKNGPTSWAPDWREGLKKEVTGRAETGPTGWEASADLDVWTFEAPKRIT